MNAVSLLSVLTVSKKTANALYIGVLSVCQSLSQNFQVCKIKIIPKTTKKKARFLVLPFKFTILLFAYSSATTGLYFGTRAFMMHQPMR